MEKKDSSIREIDIYDIMLTLANHKIMIIAITFIISLATVIYVLIVPEKWTATTTFKTMTSEDTPSFSSSLLGIGSSLFGGMSTSSTDHLITLHSKHFRQEIIDHFNLIEYLEITDPDPLVRNDLAHEKVMNEVLFIGINEETQLISVKIKTEDRDLSVKIANYCREYLDRYTKEMRMTKSKEKRIFLEERIASLQDSIDATGLELTRFQEENNITELESQAKELIAMYSELISNRITLESELEVTNLYAQEGSFSTEVIQKKLDLLDEKIKELQENNKASSSFSLKEIPSLMYEYTKLKLKLTIFTSTYEFLYPQMESARIKELEETDSIEIVDVATPSGIRAEPRRAITCIVMFIAGFLFSSLLALYIDSVTDEQKEKFSLVIRKLFSRKNARK